jgi:hypothetical protein
MPEYELVAVDYDPFEAPEATKRRATKRGQAPRATSTGIGCLAEADASPSRSLPAGLPPPSAPNRDHVDT